MLAPKSALKAWKDDPPRFVRQVLKVTPDPWQDEVLAAFPHHQRIAMKGAAPDEPIFFDDVLHTGAKRHLFLDEHRDSAPVDPAALCRAFVVERQLFR